MTSTSFNIGLNDDTRMSSRVLRPPGGGHTDIFGGEPEPPRTGRRMVSAASNTAPQPPSAPSADNVVQASTNEPPAATAAEQAPAPEPAARPHEKPAPAAPQPAQAQRVRVPPGGFSSGLW